MNNFRVDTNGPLGPGTVTIEKTKTDKPINMLVFRDMAQKILHSSMLFPGKCESGFMKNKTDVIYVKTISQTGGKLGIHVCKMSVSV